MKSLVACAVLVALAGCSSGPAKRVVDLYGGADAWAAVASPEAATAYRVVRPGVLTYVRAPDTIDGYEITQGPVAVDAATARELATILGDDAIYDWERAKGCDFDPGVAVRFARAGREVDVLFCFKCDELAAFVGGRRVGGEDFDVARPRLLAVFRRLFPHDEALQSLR
jgi:hypothetical protein